MAASPWVDYAIAAALLVATEIELWRLPQTAPSNWDRAGGVLVAIGTSVPLAWRRRAPLICLAIVIGTQAAPAHWLFHPAEQGNGPLIPFLAALLASFSFGAYGRAARQAWHVLAVLTGTGVAMFAQAALGHFDGSFWVACAVFWVMGWLYRQRLLRVSELEGETAQLRHDRDAAARAAVAEERSRIARELHDVVAHSVSVMTVQAGAARHTLDPADTDMCEALESIETAGRQALVELRRLLGILRRADDEPALSPVPSLAQIDGLIAQVREAGLPAILRVEGDCLPLAPGVDLAAYRIVQEALTNSLKHGRPNSTQVIVRYGRHHLDLDIVDDGPPALPGKGTGHGLIGMRERATLYGGTLDVGPRPEGGFRVHARIPLNGTIR